MSVKDLGRVVPLLRGVYDPTEGYEPLDLVFFDEATYAAKDYVTGEDPDTSDKWQLVVRGFISEAQIEQIVTAIMGEIEAEGYVQDTDYVHTDNNFTDEYKEFIDNWEPPVGEEFEGLALEATRGDFIFTLVTNGMRYSYDKENWVDMPYGFMVNIEQGTTIYLWARTKQTADTRFSITPSSPENLITISGILDSFHFPYYYDVAFRGSEYTSIFSSIGCTLDIHGLVLPHTDMTQSCYAHMFYGCALNGTGVPALPATTLANNCYDGMYQNASGVNITGLTLPATTLKEGCYGMMFNSAVFTNPDISDLILPATKVANQCYHEMFTNTNITYPPVIRLTDWNEYRCCFAMFMNCTSLLEVPDLTIGEIYQDALLSMFQGCTSITDASNIIFTSTGNAPNDSAGAMFAGCSSLVTAPIITFTSAGGSAFNNMFWECTSLQYIECHVLSVDNSEYVGWENFVFGVNEIVTSGTFVIGQGASWYTDSNWGIPTGWSVSSTPVTPPAPRAPLRLTCSDDNVVVQFHTAWRWGGDRYRINGGEWVVFNPEEYQYITLTPGDYIEFDNNNDWWDSQERWWFGTSGDGHLAVSGDISTICYNMHYYAKPPETQWELCTDVFNGCTNITDARNLILSVVGGNMYIRMFYGCTGLVYPPQISFDTITYGSFQDMFRDCTNLLSVMDLSGVTRVAEATNTETLQNMYWGCSSLTNITNGYPVNIVGNEDRHISATNMFRLCTSITTVPDNFFGSAYKLAGDFSEMFCQCSSLNYIKDVELGIINHSNWLYDVAQSGTFVMTNKNIIDPDGMRGTNAIPEGWTVLYAEDLEV